MSKYTDIRDTLLKFVMVSDEVLKRAQMFKKASTSTVKSASVKIPAAVEALVSGQRVHPHEREAVSKKLASHAGCLELITKLAFHQVAPEADKIGKPYGKQSSSQRGVTRLRGATPADWDETEAGQVFKQLLIG